MSTKHPSGSALPTVLALVSVILVAGLAMGSLSTLSLQFQRRTSVHLQAEYAARSAVAMFIADVQSSADELNPLVRSGKPMSETFTEPLVYKLNRHEVSIHFNQNQPGYSTDNLSGDRPAFGWPDGSTPKVPPFGLDLILNVEGPNQINRYRATLDRVWPYAVYVSGGGLIITNRFSEEHGTAIPSLVEGDVYTSDFSEVPPEALTAADSGGGTETGTDSEPETSSSDPGGWSPPEDMAAIFNPASNSGGTYELDNALNKINSLELHSGFQAENWSDKPLAVGSKQIKYHEGKEPVNIVQGNSETTYHYPLSTFEGPMNNLDSLAQEAIRPMPRDENNKLDGNLYYDSENSAGTKWKIETFGTNSMTGEVIERRRPAGLSLLTSSDFSSREMFRGVDFTELDTSQTPFSSTASDPSSLTSAMDENSKQFMLSETLTLTEADGTHFEITGSIVNRDVRAGGETLQGVDVRETPAGLSLQGVTLHVTGDVDLGSYEGAQPFTISGSDATLVVDGTLTIGNAIFDAADRDFVISAKSIVFAGGGTFHGLIMARENIVIQADSDQKLKFEGGLIAGGDKGITIRGAEVIHNPEYVKSMNRAGNFKLVQWQKVD